MPTAPIATGTAVAAAPEDPVEEVEDEPVADAPLAVPVVEPVAEVLSVLETPKTEEYEESAALCTLASELASAFNELFAVPVAVAASEDIEAIADEAAWLALE